MIHQPFMVKRIMVYWSPLSSITVAKPLYTIIKHTFSLSVVRVLVVFKIPTRTKLAEQQSSEASRSRFCLKSESFTVLESSTVPNQIWHDHIQDDVSITVSITCGTIQYPWTLPSPLQNSTRFLRDDTPEYRDTPLSNLIVFDTPFNACFPTVRNGQRIANDGSSITLNRS